MKHWISISLGRKFAFALTAAVLTASTVFLVLFIVLYRDRLVAERAQASEQLTLLLQAALENAMLKRDLDGLEQIVQRLGSQPGVNRVMIANPHGEIRFASDPAMLGRQFDAKTAAGCAECHAGRAQAEGRSIFLTQPDGAEVMRAVNPVRNKEPCQQCHGPMADHPINGILLIDYDAAPIRAHALETAGMLMGAGAAVVAAMMAALWWLLRRLVLDRLARLAEASRAIDAGRLDVRAAAGGQDEIGKLGEAFDAMVATIRARIQDIRDKEGFLQSLIDAIPDGIRVIDGAHRIVKANRAYRGQTAQAEDTVVGQTCHQSSHQRDTPCPANLVACPLDVVTREGQAVKTVHRHRRADGGEIEVEVYAAPMVVSENGQPRTYMVESIRDLAERVRFSHEQKLSAVGQLAAGVAHEIRNPLASVRLALQGALRYAGNDDANAELRVYLGLVDGQIDKCLEVTDRLLKLSASGAERRSLVEINRAAEETLSLVRYHANVGQVKVITDFDPSSPRIMSSDGDMRMLVLNLVQNAFHAMPDGGILRVATSQEAGTVHLVVTDTGVGIAPDHMKRIFEPFFSHRADGKHGTGLGLAICKSIVESMNGTIAVDSDPGHGARFTVSVPSAQSVVEGTRP